MGRLGRKKKRARGARWEGGREKRGSRRFPLPIVPRALSIFSIIDILMGIPSGSLCGGESLCKTILFIIINYFTQNIPFLIGLCPMANSSQPTAGIDRARVYLH